MFASLDAQSYVLQRRRLSPHYRDMMKREERRLAWILGHRISGHVLKSFVRQEEKTKRR